jgi:hypothetical protein
MPDLSKELTRLLITVKSKGKFALEQAIKAQKGNSGIAVYFGVR